LRELKSGGKVAGISPAKLSLGTKAWNRPLKKRGKLASVLWRDRPKGREKEKYKIRCEGALTIYFVAPSWSCPMWSKNGRGPRGKGDKKSRWSKKKKRTYLDNAEKRP